VAPGVFAVESVDERRRIMAPETQDAAAARDGFVTYDELRGPDPDAARWSPARLPRPTGGEHIPLDPNAELPAARARCE
jgi:hypothetical protein